MFEAEYVERTLIKVTDPDNAMNVGIVNYYAVDDDSADNMLGVDYGRMGDEQLRKIQVELIGTVEVQLEELLGG